MGRVDRCWDRLPRKGVESLSLEAYKRHVDMMVSKVV